ncbi:MAG TPA: type II secretion system protein GspE, partial [Candidatus Polarisedimenticolia bacterium]
SMPPQALMDIGYAPDDAKKVKLFKGKGCPTCNNTGYKGRVGLYEVMEIGDSVREMILTGASSIELKNKAQEEGMISLRGSGLRKIAAGLTTVEEVVRETVL